MSDRDLTRTWRTWRASVENDDPAVDLKPGGGVTADTITTTATVIALRVFAKDADNDTGILEIVGRMDPTTRYGDGIGQSLWKGTLRLGAEVLGGTAGEQPLDDGRWNLDDNWRAVDIWDELTGTGAHDAAKIVKITGSDQTVILLPTYGYTHLQAVFTEIGGGSPEMANPGILYRELSHGDVLQIKQEV